MSTICSFRLSWAVLEESLVLGRTGSPLFLVGFPEHPALIGWQCFPRASRFRGLHFMADLTRCLLGGEGCCWFSFSLMWSWKEKRGKVRTAACPPLGCPPSCPSSVETTCLWPLEGGVPPRKVSPGAAASAAWAGPWGTR